MKDNNTTTMPDLPDSLPLAEDFDESQYYSDLIENFPNESCPRCGNDYDDADFDFQICSRCGFDNNH